MRLLLLIASATLVLAGCGDEPAADEPESGIAGQVLLGPQCPVESLDEPCDALPAADVLVRVSGDQDATTRTDADGAFRLDLAPGDYVVTADAGMSCELIDAHVTAGAYATVDVPCDTGIR
ncbi:MAG: carboxypeptidase-like regulatory domain-containing protein [Nocardioides sp.]|nr:carboxypeptidase-like regulatory domain-containing protein [Nocardioides sp.]